MAMAATDGSRIMEDINYWAQVMQALDRAQSTATVEATGASEQTGGRLSPSVHIEAARGQHFALTAAKAPKVPSHCSRPESVC